MDTLSIPYGHIYKFTADLNLVEKIQSKIKTLEFKQATANSQSDDTFYDKELYDWLHLCIRKTADKLLLPQTINLVITSCWANRNKKLQTHHPHNHGNSFMSGIFYLTDSINGGQTVFSSPNLWGENFKWLSFEKSIFTPPQLTVSPTKGTLLLFPSALHHKVNPLKDSDDRFSIAFNVFFSGKFGDSVEKTYLAFDTESVEERLKKL